jgi:hypothetical protein
MAQGQLESKTRDPPSNMMFEVNLIFIVKDLRFLQFVLEKGTLIFTLM